jgi:hypothetical protein
MPFVSDFDTNKSLELGTQYLLSEGWLPPRCDPSYVLQSIKTRNYDACRGRMMGGTFVSSNVVERAAISYSLLRELGEAQAKPLVMWEMLEALGNEVSPEFAELGSDAALVLTVAHDLQRNHNVDYLRRDLALRSIGRLWNAAFTGPPGYEQYIARSAAGGVPPALNFFEAVPGADLQGPALGLYLARLVDLLQAAIAMKDLPETRVGASLQIGSWGESGRPHGERPRVAQAQSAGAARTDRGDRPEQSTGHDEGRRHGHR